MGEMAWSDPHKSAAMKAKILLGRFARPIDVAHAVAYLLSDQAAMIHGVTLPVDGRFLATR
jgi:NAD(P)-dependent dehydrogenase (short-subunit alcohol dehydrogenase family)